jgi:hypothetical protein
MALKIEASSERMTLGYIDLAQPVFEKLYPTHFLRCRSANGNHAHLRIVNKGTHEMSILARKIVMNKKQIHSP